ncbi:hypothetical protein L7F22_008915 [Adiantum nelumboides]|nr:hypothetical protein [Adiantum nelumboides]
MSMAKALGIAFSTVTLFTGIIPLYGFSLSFEGPPPLVWGWLIVSFFTWFVALALAEICSSFPTAGSLYFWTAHLAGPRWGPFASWCCAWLELLGTIAGIGAQAYAGSQVLQNIVLLSTGTHKGGGYFAPPWVCLCIYICMAVIWGFLNTFTLEVVAYIGIVSIWWQVIGGMLFVLYLPFVAPRKQSASFVFLNFVELSTISRVPSKGYGVIMSLLISQYSLFGYDAAAHLTEETKDADLNGPIAILYSLAMVSLLGWAVILVLTFCIQDPFSLYDLNNETGGSFVPAQILYDIFFGRYHNGLGAVLMLVNIWGSFFFGGLSTTTSAARIVYALARDGGLPYSLIWKKLHSRRKVPANAVWLCISISILMGLPILKLKVLFTAISSICTIGWVGSHAVALFARAQVPSKGFQPGRFHLEKAGRGVCWVALGWVCYTCVVFLLPTQYPIQWGDFNYAPIAVSLVMSFSLIWWAFDARHWFKGPLPNIS